MMRLWGLKIRMCLCRELVMGGGGGGCRLLKTGAKQGDRGQMWGAIHAINKSQNYFRPSGEVLVVIEDRKVRWERPIFYIKNKTSRNLWLQRERKEVRKHSAQQWGHLCALPSRLFPEGPAEKAHSWLVVSTGSRGNGLPLSFRGQVAQPSLPFIDIVRGKGWGRGEGLMSYITSNRRSPLPDLKFLGLNALISLTFPLKSYFEVINFIILC